jgi:hypothetical protein
MGFADKVREALGGRKQESPADSKPETEASEPNPAEGAGGAEQAPNATKAAEDVD